MGKLSGKVALVTGAASGIGLACAERFASEGAIVAGMDLAEVDAKAWKRVADNAAGDAFYAGDVVDEGRVEAIISDVLGLFEKLDILVNAAGVAGGGAVHMVGSDDWDRVVDINLKGTFLCSKHALTSMMAQRSGSIVNIASVEGLEGTEGGSAYNASKGGVVILTKNMAIDYGRSGIRVNAVCPGFIDTPMLRSVFDDDSMKEFLVKIVDAHQLGRLGKPEEIASAVAFLSSEDASFITGHSLVVDGGFSAGKRFGFGKLMGLE
jgi:meso-butanediol dehydrogenase/(S,S)-butanediol dehydrogenase/diacetyl reductase